MQCQSVRSTTQRGARCPLPCQGDNRYCNLHLKLGNIVEYQSSDRYIPNPSAIHHDPKPKLIMSDYTRAAYIQGPITRDTSEPQPGDNKTDQDKTRDLAITSDDTYITTQAKLMIINKENPECISELIGPVFHDITSTDDEYDPVTMTQFLIVDENGKKPAPVDKYTLFSYTDDKGQVRCLTIFTIKHIIDSYNHVHPCGDKIPNHAIQRAFRLINYYNMQVGLFTGDTKVNKELYDMVNSLFIKFESFSLFFDPMWLLEINDVDKYNAIIKECRSVIRQNTSLVNPIVSKITLFDDDTRKMSRDELIRYIIDQWEKLYAIRHPQSNQMPIWMMAASMKDYAPKLLEKYPHLIQ